MKKFFILCLVFIACSGNNIAEETVENSATASSLFQPATTIYKFKSLAKYGYTLEEIDGEYCIFFLEYKSDPFKCFEDESEAIENFKFMISSFPIIPPSPEWGFIPAIMYLGFKTLKS